MTISGAVPDRRGALLASHQRGTQAGHNAFTLLSVEHHCANNLGADVAALLGHTEIEQGTYKNHFHCAPAAAAVVPRHLPKPTANGVQSALVVGHSAEPLETERDHRIKLRFAWQNRSGGGGAAGESGENTGDFPENAAGTWVRVALYKGQVLPGSGSRKRQDQQRRLGREGSRAVQGLRSGRHYARCASG